jgi:hypothetical protein
VHGLLTLFAVALISMTDVTVIVAASNAASAAASPAPQLDTESWKWITLSDCGIRPKLPKNYTEHNWAVRIGQPISHSYRARTFDRIDVDIKRLIPNTSFDQNKVIRQSDYEGYSECTEMIGGRAAIIQSFLGGGVIIDKDRRFPNYSVYALWSLPGSQLLKISGSAATREGQEEMLAALRTVEFIR